MKRLCGAHAATAIYAPWRPNTYVTNQVNNHVCAGRPVAARRAGKADKEAESFAQAVVANDGSPSAWLGGHRDPRDARHWLLPVREPPPGRHLGTDLCPLRCGRARLRTLREAQSHLRNVHNRSGSRGLPKWAEHARLEEFARQHGAWWCTSHSVLVPATASASANADGMFVVRNGDCARCGAAATRAVQPFEIVHRLPRPLVSPPSSTTASQGRPSPRYTSRTTTTRAAAAKRDTVLSRLAAVRAERATKTKMSRMLSAAVGAIAPPDADKGESPKDVRVVAPEAGGPNPAAASESPKPLPAVSRPPTPNKDKADTPRASTALAGGGERQYEVVQKRTEGDLAAIWRAPHTVKSPPKIYGNHSVPPSAAFEVPYTEAPPDAFNQNINPAGADSGAIATTRGADANASATCHTSPPPACTSMDTAALCPGDQSMVAIAQVLCALSHPSGNAPRIPRMRHRVKTLVKRLAWRMFPPSVGLWRLLRCVRCYPVRPACPRPLPWGRKLRPRSKMGMQPAPPKRPAR